MFPVLYNKSLQGRRISFDGADNFYIILPIHCEGQRLLFKTASITIDDVRKSILRFQLHLSYTAQHLSQDITFTDVLASDLPFFHVPPHTYEEVKQALEENIALLEWMAGCMEERDFELEKRRKRIDKESDEELEDKELRSGYK